MEKRQYNKKTDSGDRREQRADRPGRRDVNDKPRYGKSQSRGRNDRRNSDGDEERERPRRRYTDKRSNDGFEDRERSPRRPRQNGFKSRGQEGDDKSFRRRKPAVTAAKQDHPEGAMRLNKYIAHAGICSRREADELIAAGSVKVNGRVVTEMGYLVMPGDEVSYGGEKLRSERLRYFLLNKPKGFITTTDDPQERRTVMMLMDGCCSERIYPVGRLDRATTGLLLFTNDGELAKKLTHPSSQVYKIYQVELNKPVTKEDMRSMLEGIELDDGPIKVDDVQYVTGAADKRVVGVELHSGRNRIVRRIFESLGYEVHKLDRVVFAGLTKKDLPRGRWRELTDKEVGFLKMI